MLCLILPLAGQAASTDSHSLSTNTELAIEGYFVLSWELPASTESAAVYELQQADNPEFLDATHIAIPAAGDITLSGFRDGDYYFRAGDGSAWTQAITVTVDHPSMARALAFFLLGLALFIVLVISIVIGTRRHHADFNNFNNLNNDGSNA